MIRPGSLIGLDIGTSGARAVAIDLLGNVVASASASYPLSVPRPGWTEQDPQQWWSASQDVLKRVVSRLPHPPLALGLTGQMHGSVFLDEGDRVIRPALLWSDQRTENECRTIIEKVGGHPTGNPGKPAVVLANLRRTTTGLKAGTFIVTGSFTGFHPVELNQPVTGEFEGFGTMEATIVG